MTKKPVGNVGKSYKSYTEEFRREAVRMLESEGLTASEAGRRVGDRHGKTDWSSLNVH